jgi:hypothetical protein
MLALAAAPKPMAALSLAAVAIGERQRVLAKEMHDANLLSDEGWTAVEGK